MCGLEYDDEERRLCWAGTGGGHVLSGIQGSCLASHGVGSSARGVGQAIVADHSLIVNETSQLRPKKKNALFFHLASQSPVEGSSVIL